MRPIRLGYNAVPRSARKAILDVFDSGQFSPGPKVKAFEAQFAALHGTRHGIFVNSGTDALRLGLLALKEKYGWQDNDEVAVPTLTFPATVNVILQSGLKPFFVDVGMNDYLINPDNLERRQPTSKLKAVMPVHLFGQPCDDRIFNLAKEMKLKVLEDSCETIGNNIRGDVSCHSTYMAHHIVTGVGGIALTNDAELNLLIRSYANHGRSIVYLPGYEQSELSKDLLKKRFCFDRQGYSCRGTEFEAALGLSQLKGLKDNIWKRRLVASWLYRGLCEFDDFKLPSFTEDHTFMMFPIVLKENSTLDKYEVCLNLEKHGIETRDMMPITHQPCYKNFFQNTSFSVAEWINKNGFYVPCHPGMDAEDAAYVVQHLTNRTK